MSRRFDEDRHGRPAGWVTRGLAFVRFGFVGIACSALSAAALYLLTAAAGMEPALAAAVSYLLVLPVNYLLQLHFTFAHVREPRRGVPSFVAVHALGMGLSVATVHVVVSVLAWPLAVAIAALLSVVPVLQFVLLESFVFQSRNRP